MPDISLGERLREERERLGYTQPAFAALVGASKRSQIGWEQGRTSPDASALAVWAGVGVDALYVLTGQRAPGVTGKSDLPSVASPIPAEPSLTDQAATAGQIPAMPKLNRREQALLANYRGSDDEGRRAMEATASALAHRDSAKPQRNGGE